MRTVVELARTLHLETVAEGIETLTQSRILAQLACDLGQGYLFARPLVAESVEAFFGGAVPAHSSAPPPGRGLRSVRGSIAS